MCLVKSGMAMYVIAFMYSLMDVNEIICILIFEHERGEFSHPSAVDTMTTTDMLLLV